MNKPLAHDASQTRYEVTAHTDPENGDLLIPVPWPMLDTLQWKIGVELELQLNEFGGYTITAKQ